MKPKQAHHQRSRARRLVLILMLTMLGVPAVVQAAANIVINNLNPPGVGFNSTVPFTPVGGNYATTLGQARLNAFQYAATLAGQFIDSGQTIVVDASIESLGVGVVTILGGARPTTAHANFAGAPLGDTLYVSAQANALSGSDINDVTAEIDAVFNGDVDGVPGAGWYYGFDAQPATGQIDFVSVVLHEILHGLGFLALADVETGEKLGGLNDAFLVLLEDHSQAGVYSNLGDAAAVDSDRVAAFIDDGDLHWIGNTVTVNTGGLSAGYDVVSGHIQMYAPSTVEVGSTASHFDEVVAPNETMEPFYTEPLHHPGLAVNLLQDIGWTTNNGAGDADLDVSISPVDDELSTDVGQTVVYTVTINNVGPDVGNSSSLTFLPPTGSTLGTITSSQGTCSQANGVAWCFLDNIAAAASATVSIPVTMGTGRVGADGNISNSVSAVVSSTTQDSDQTNNIAVTTLPSNELTFAARLQSIDNGGCTTTRAANFAPLFPALVVLSLGYLLVRRRTSL